ncbi:MAG: phosphoenolpyruvate synthase [Candidatus Parcubacteria bacterium]|nr:MAG: phosphoenolpyruvate synthase [Candidatus Parcubacteria bacterium]
MARQYIRWFSSLSLDDAPLVGGKNAALGEMVRELSELGVSVPDGFAITAHAYWDFVRENHLDEVLHRELDDVDTHDVAQLQERGKRVREAFLRARFPREVEEAILEAYRDLGERYGRNPSVAVRSSATAEDLPDASFAGEQETFLNVEGEAQILEKTRECFASLFTDRAISYRADKGFSHFAVALSVGVQKMVRSDKGASGVMFTLDPETGFPGVVVVEGSWGLGEMIVQGKVTPDSFMVFKEGLRQGKDAVIAHDLGDKREKMVYGEQGGTRVVATSKTEQEQFCLSDKEILQLAQWGLAIEAHFSRKHNRPTPMDIEWAKDGTTGQLAIVQARPETVHARAGASNVWVRFRRTGEGEVLARGTAVGTKIAQGVAKVLNSPSQMARFQEGEVLVTDITDPDWEPIMKKAAAIVTNRGGRTSHAAIVARELGIPAVVGCGNATEAVRDGLEVTVDCASGKEGVVLRGLVPFEREEHRLDRIPQTRTKVAVNIGAPQEALRLWRLPVSGVGLGRLEFVIASRIGVHPNAVLAHPALAASAKEEDNALARAVAERARGYESPREFYVLELAEGIAQIAVAFYPKEVIIRFSDFKSNEYRSLLGGERYEPIEENPMIGWRGASRYAHPEFRAAFGLECEAVDRVRRVYGLENVSVMIPFVRTPQEGERVLATMAEFGLGKGRHSGLRVYLMAELPANVWRAQEFLALADGFSIGSNDLTQLIVGMDRDNERIAGVTDERDPAVKEAIHILIRECRKAGKYCGICGQAPSDYPELLRFLVREGITAISLAPDAVVPALEAIARAEGARDGGESSSA